MSAFTEESVSKTFEYKVLTLNVGGINKSPFEFFDNISSTASSKTPLELLSDKMKENISNYLQEQGENGTTLNTKITQIGINKNASKKTVIDYKNSTRINGISPTLSKVWFLAKELDRIFAKVSSRRYSIFYREFTEAEISALVDYEIFKKRWLNYFNNQTNNVNRNNQNCTIEYVRSSLTTMSKNGTNRLIPATDDKFINHENALEGLITFDYLAYKSLIDSNIGHASYVSIKSRDLGVDAKKRVLTQLLSQDEKYDIIFLQEMSPEFVIPFTGYTSYSDNNTNSMILVKDEIVSGQSVNVIHPVDGSPFSSVLGVEKNKITRANITKPASEIYAIDIGSMILISAHLNSSSGISSGELIRLNEALTTCDKPFIVGIDANNKDVGSIIFNKTCVNITSNKVRTWLQTQMNKAGRGEPKQIDYIFTTQPITKTDIVNGGKPATALAPNEDWPFDHFGVTTTVILPTRTAGGAKRRIKKRTTKKRTTKSSAKKRTSTKGKKRRA